MNDACFSYMLGSCLIRNSLRIFNDPFIHFHTYFSSPEDRGGRSPWKTRNTSRSTAISESSAGSTPRRVQAWSRCNNVTWCLVGLRSAFPSVQPAGPASPIFPGAFWSRGRTIAAGILSIRRSGSTLRASPISQLRALSQCVTSWTLRKTPPPRRLYLRYHSYSHYRNSWP